mmetsp:Transcript_22441/g.63030  ORF Transcript_22441/g.63030 Transcript_22441/m.63030 type:complete len:220 (-) Transcript_22441:503-1162(-)
MPVLAGTGTGAAKAPCPARACEFWAAAVNLFRDMSPLATGAGWRGSRSAMKAACTFASIADRAAASIFARSAWMRSSDVCDASNCIRDRVSASFSARSADVASAGTSGLAAPSVIACVHPCAAAGLVPRSALFLARWSCARRPGCLCAPGAGNAATLLASLSPCRKDSGITIWQPWASLHRAPFRSFFQAFPGSLPVSSAPGLLEACLTPMPFVETSRT